MWRVKLSKGGYRLVFWLMERYGQSGRLRSGRDGWAKRARVDLGYTQPAVSMLAKELVEAGIFKKTSSGYTYSLGEVGHDAVQ